MQQPGMLSFPAQAETGMKQTQLAWKCRTILKTNRPAEKENPRLNQSDKKMYFDDEVANINDLLRAGFDKMLHPKTRYSIRKFHPVGEATGEGDTSALCSILARNCANSEVTRLAMTDTLGELTLCLV